MPTAQVEENKKTAEARRVRREAARRVQMDAEAEDFIEADEEGGGDEEDDDDYNGAYDEDVEGDDDEEEVDLD